MPPSRPDRHRLLLALALRLALTAPLAGASPIYTTLYGVAEDPNQLLTIDKATAAPALVGNLGVDASNSDLAMDPTRNILYMSDAAIDGFAQVGLAKIDLETGVASFLGDHGASINIAGLAYVKANDTLYGSDMDSNQLVTIDRNTGATTPVGPFGIIGMRDLAYNPSTDTLYGIDGFSLFTVNRSTGNATYLGRLNNTFTFSNLMDSLAFDASTGQLYGGDWGGTYGPNRNATLYVIAPVTGLATPIAHTGLHLLGALEFGPPRRRIFVGGFESGALPDDWSAVADSP
jgi:hypothetical protein